MHAPEAGLFDPGADRRPDVYLRIAGSDRHSVEFLGRMTADGNEIEGGLGMIPAVLVRR